MTSGSEREFGGDPSNWVAPKSTAQRRGSAGVMAWLKGLLGRKETAPQERAQSQDAWLFEGTESAEAQEAFGPDWLPQDLESWKPRVSRPAAAPRANGPVEPAPAMPLDTFEAETTTANAAAAAPVHADAAPQGSLIVQNLNKAYKKRQVIKDVSLMLHRGEAVGLLGPNGAGKTTLFYMITGLIRPDAGVILLDDYDVTTLPMYRRARLGIGYLPQEPSIFRGLTVEENIRAVLEITQPDKKKRAEELEALLEEFDITRLRKLPAIALSGGERRRCEIARSLAGHPSFMLLDEPFAGIDPIAIGDIRQLVLHLKNRGIGVLITDHNVRETLDLIDRAYIVHDGGILTEGAPDEIVANADVRRFYLGESFKL
jgi:lipopolysaccharide export system ATP-binding protein